MQLLKKFHLLQLIFILNIIFFPSSISQDLIHCGTIRTKSSYHNQNSSNPSQLSQIIPCKSNNYKRRLLKMGTRVSFDVPDHVPNPCDQCEKRDGNCGAGLRCLCHPKLCKDKVVSVGAVLKPYGNILFYMVLFIIVMGFFHES
ncbi:hypothetical protein BUALT_Bualt13G0061900 [Buddleja alternifolia]|uniref:Uncharacterized protein n=1 Tax=Buddleja alternifolia TaxID=168488 RepID=A0AAV6WKX1_9LAMI|nr:hypothetical protein BUALT_Bualt13G0061900 [Buddleja alternifolia]